LPEFPVTTTLAKFLQKDSISITDHNQRGIILHNRYSLQIAMDRGAKNPKTMEIY